MKDSRSLEDLAPALKPLAFRFKTRVESLIPGIAVIFACTYRDEEMQARLYAQGRTAPGRIVTNAKPGESNHNKKNEDGYPASRAFDVFLTMNGKSVYTLADGDQVSDPLWQKVGEIGRSVGLVWGGDFKSFPEGPHFELPKEVW